MDGQWPNESKTMNLLESGPVTKCSMSLNIDHNRLVGIRMNKTNSERKVLLGQVRGRYVLIYFFETYTNIQVLGYTVIFSLDF